MEHTVDKQTMDSLEALARMNMRISEARETMTKLQAIETAYLQKREEKALARIDKALEGSRALLIETKNNNEEIKNFASTVTGFAGFLVEAYQTFDGLVRDFDDRDKAWEENIKKQEKAIAFLKRELEGERIKIENSKKFIESQRHLLEADKRKLEDQRGTLARAIERLKNNKV